MQILLVDDSKTMRTIQRRCLNKIGLGDETIVEAKDGQEALRLFDKIDFDLVISDWNMPALDGMELLLSIRQRDKSVPVIMVTTEAERSCVLSAIQAGCSDYLVKPFSPWLLKEKLQKWLDIPWRSSAPTLARQS